jgi:hypothetical protein
MADEAQIELEPQFETPVIENGELAYQIQMARRSDGIWFQRHLWFRDQLGTHTPPVVDHWIKGVQSGPSESMYDMSEQVPA